MEWSAAGDLLDIMHLVAALELSALNQTERNTVKAVALADYSGRAQDPLLAPLAVKLLAPQPSPKAPYARSK